MESMAALTEIASKAPAAWAHAVDTFGTEERASRWMRISLSELGNRTPEEILMDDPKNSEVEAILTRIDYGVYS
jgi:putative toxin-antitoxin system antitoxin component (TIGR02293 family)